jgi:hypothetical protein
VLLDDVLRDDASPDDVSAAVARDPERVEWLVVSIVASVVLTVLLNVAIRLWPGASDRAARQMTEWAERQLPDSRAPGGRQGGVRVVVPWKAMLIVSVALTILLNLVLRIF